MLAVPVSTAGIDPWFAQEQNQIQAISRTADAPAPSRRSISLAEARRLSLEILAAAEADRRHAADEEARQALKLEDF